MPRLPLLVLLGISALAGPALAAPPAVCTRWEDFTPSRGFPAEQVYDLALDGGTVWAATSAGLVRGNTEHWEVIGATPDLPAIPAWAVTVADNGDVWAGTARGLVRWSGGRVERFTGENSGLLADAVYDVVVLDQQVWAATAGGLARLDLRSGAWSGFSPENSPLPVETVQRLLVDGRGLWLATFGGGLLHFDPPTRAWRAFRDPDADPRQDVLRDDGLLHDAPTALALAGPAGELWIGHEDGLARLAGETFSTVLPESSERLPTGKRTSPHLLALASVGQRLFVGTDAGLAVWDQGRWVAYQAAPDGHGTRVLRLATRPGEPQPEQRLALDLPSRPVLALAVDGQQLWVGTAAGLARCQGDDDAPPATAVVPAPRPAPSPASPAAASPAGGRRAHSYAPPLDLTALPAALPARRGPLPAAARELRLGLVLPAAGQGEGLAAAVEQGLRQALAEAAGDPAAEATDQASTRLPAAGPAAPTAPLLPVVLHTVTLPARATERQAAEAGRQLVEEQAVRALILPPGAGEQVNLQLAQLARQYEVPLLLLGDDDPALAASGKPWVVSLGWTARTQMRALSQRLRALDLRRPVLIRDDSRFGRAGGGLFSAETRGPRLTLAGEVVHRPGQSLAATAQAVRALQPDALVLWTSGRRAGELLRALRAVGLRQPCFGPARLATPGFLEQGGELAEGCVVALATRTRPDAAAAEGATAPSGPASALVPWTALGVDVGELLVGILRRLPAQPDRAAFSEKLRALLPTWEPPRTLPNGDGRGGVPLGVVRGGQVIVEGHRRAGRAVASPRR